LSNPDQNTAGFTQASNDTAGILAMRFGNRHAVGTGQILVRTLATVVQVNLFVLVELVVVRNTGERRDRIHHVNERSLLFQCIVQMVVKVFYRLTVEGFIVAVVGGRFQTLCQLCAEEPLDVHPDPVFGIVHNEPVLIEMGIVRRLCQYLQIQPRLAARRIAEDNAVFPRRNESVMAIRAGKIKRSESAGQ
jgi:hypothetical protein